MKRLTLSIILLFLAAASSFAVNCHCFTVRDFDPADPASVDPYILATSSNSLLAGSLGSEKSPVVKLRMGGAEEADVWLGLTAAKTAGKDAGEFFAAKEKLGTWSKAYSSLGFDSAKFGPGFSETLTKDEGVAAEKLADMVLAASFPTLKGSIPPLRGEGATTGQTTAALFYGLETGKDPLTAYKEVKAGRSSWGNLFHDAGISPKTVSPRIISLARPPALAR